MSVEKFACDKCHRKWPASHMVRIKGGHARLCHKCLSFWEFDDGATTEDLMNGTKAGRSRVERMKEKLTAKRAELDTHSEPVETPVVSIFGARANGITLIR